MMLTNHARYRSVLKIVLAGSLLTVAFSAAGHAQQASNPGNARLKEEKRLLELEREIHLQQMAVDQRRAELELERAKQLEQAREAERETGRGGPRMRNPLQQRSIMERRVRNQQTFLDPVVPQPAPKGGRVEVFRLKYTQAEKVAEVVEQILSGQPNRVAADERSNSLIVNAPDELFEPVRALIRAIDVPGAAGEEPRDKTAAPYRCYQVHVYWLASQGEGATYRDPERFLPDAVTKAVATLGVDAPGLVIQATNSVALSAPDSKGVVSVESQAIVGGQTATLQMKGTLACESDRANALVELSVGGAYRCSLSGSIVAPVGHYVVLGTADSLPRGTQSDFGGGGFGGAAGMGASGPPTRFAFVLQVVEADSFAPIVEGE